MMGLDLSNTSGSVLAIYFTDDGGAKNVYNFRLGDIRHINLAHDYTGSLLESEINLPNPQYAYIQSMGGTNIEVDLSSVQSLDNKLINRVQLEVTVAEVPGDDISLYPNIPNIFGSFRNDNGDLELISDLSTLAEVGFELTLDNIGAFFGGIVQEIDENGVIYTRYNFNITNHVLEILDGEISDPSVTLVAFSKQERTQRTILHSDINIEETKPKLKVVLTDP